MRILAKARASRALTTCTATSSARAAAWPGLTARPQAPRPWRAASLLFRASRPGAPEKAACDAPTLGDVGGPPGRSAVCLPGPSPAKHFLAAPKGALEPAGAGAAVRGGRDAEAVQAPPSWRPSGNAGGLLAFAPGRNVPPRGPTSRCLTLGRGPGRPPGARQPQPRGLHV